MRQTLSSRRRFHPTPCTLPLAAAAAPLPVSQPISPQPSAAEARQLGTAGRAKLPLTTPCQSAQRMEPPSARPVLKPAAAEPRSGAQLPLPVPGQAKVFLDVGQPLRHFLEARPAFRRRKYGDKLERLKAGAHKVAAAP